MRKVSNLNFTKKITNLSLLHLNTLALNLHFMTNAEFQN